MKFKLVRSIDQVGVGLALRGFGRDDEDKNGGDKEDTAPALQFLSMTMNDQEYETADYFAQPFKSTIAETEQCQ